MGFFKKKAEKVQQYTKEQLKSIKTPQEVLGFEKLFKNGIVESTPGNYSKFYKLEDINFKTAGEEKQERIFENYGNLLNSIDVEAKLQVFSFNKSMPKRKLQDDILIQPAKDDYNYLRNQMNDILKEKAETGRNSLVKENYIGISIKADSPEYAVEEFKRIDSDIASSIRTINGQTTEPLTGIERAELLYSICNINDTVPLYRCKVDDEGKILNESFTFESLKERGQSIKDLIAPSSFVFQKANHFMIDDIYARSILITNLPKKASATIYSDFSNIPGNVITSFFVEPVNPMETAKLIKNQRLNIRQNIIEAKKRAAKDNHDLIPPALEEAEIEAEILAENVNVNDQNLFVTSFYITVFGHTLDELNALTKNLLTIASRNLCQLKVLNNQQMKGFRSCLPIVRDEKIEDRLLTTEDAALFMPFSTAEYSQKNGFYYGLNAVSNNMIMYNRKLSKNGNGIIMGKPGSGKSFATKREIFNLFLSTTDDIFIIDPDREYTELAKALGGQVITISPGGENHLNPFDMDLEYAEGTDPVSLKVDFVTGLLQSILGGKFGLGTIEVSIIDRCVRQIYQKYLEEMLKLNNKSGSNNYISINTDLSPTFRDLYDAFKEQDEQEAWDLATGLERYLNTPFAYKTNVNTENRLIVYDIKDIGKTMKEMGIQICLNDVWNRTIATGTYNKTSNLPPKYTWFYIDEFYLLMKSEESSAFLQEIWKRARKWSGIPTGITQNVEDLLASHEGRTIVSTSDFVMLLDQAPLDRNQLVSLLNLSEVEAGYITSANEGEGLIYNGACAIPFKDKFPKNNDLYRIMTTKPDEVKQSVAKRF